MLTYFEALEKIFSHLPDLQIQSRKLTRCNGYYLAEDLRSPVDLPGFDNSAMDGYALKSADTKNASVTSPLNLKVIDESVAGHHSNELISQNECIYISTGAKIPAGTDVVVPVEKVEQNNSGLITIRKPAQKHQHIRFTGEEIKAGDLVFEKGSKLTAAHLGMLAAFGITNPLVYKKPTVGFIATGDELVPPDQIPEPGYIRNSNTSIMQALVENTGCKFDDLGIARDGHNDLYSILKDRSMPDILITSAGVSMGKYDQVSDTLKKMGLKIIFWKVAIKPGKPLVFGVIHNTLFFGVPGNPVSAAVVFQQIIAPVLMMISGAKLPFRMVIGAKSLDPFKATRGRLNFARGKAIYNKEWQVTSAGKQGSHMLSGLAHSNCLIIIPPDKQINKGETVQILLHESPYISWAEFRKAIF